MHPTWLSKFPEALYPNLQALKAYTLNSSGLGLQP